MARAVGAVRRLLHDPGRHHDRLRRDADDPGGPAAPTSTPSSGSPAPTCWPTPCRCSSPAGSATGSARAASISSGWRYSPSRRCGAASPARIGGLIAARVVQGLGAAVMTPQTMAVITRTFPAESRGRAMSLWGAVAGVATLVGPILGGVLVDGLGWEWIFFVNVPVGVVGLRARRPARAGAAHPRAPVRPAGRRALGRRHVPAGLRHPGGSELRLGHDRGPGLGVVADHRGPRGAGGLRRLAGAHDRGSRC